MSTIAPSVQTHLRPKTTRILVADDHEVVRKGVIHILAARPDFEVVGEVQNGREAVVQSLRLKPDVVVLDIMMPELNGLEATRQIVKVQPEVQVLIFSMHESDDLVREVLASGARGYVLKSDTGRDLIAAVAMLSQKKPFFSPSVTDVVLTGFLGACTGGSTTQRQSCPLSPREREVVQLLAEGMSNKGAASQLQISVKTIETHRAHVMTKLNLTSISDLVRYAIRNHISSS